VSSRWIDALFAPASVAVYGASRQEGKLGHTLLRNTVSKGFTGTVVPVNPAGGEILGRPAVTSLAAPVDLALISVPARRAPDAVADAARAGCRVAIVLSSGFGEAGGDGRALQDELLRIARDAGMRLIGPNCMGVLAHLCDGAWLDGTYFWAVPTQPGPVTFMSQSGAFGGMFFSEARKRGLGLARFVSLGNAADVTGTDVLAELADDEATGVVAMFVEGIADGRRFVEVARRVAARKPVVVLKGGKGQAGARAAASHTGSLAGRHAATQAAFARAGVIEARDSDAFFDAVTAAASDLPASRGPRIAVLTISGGPSVLAADAAERTGLALPAPREATLARLRPLVPDFAALGNPVDLTPQCPPDAYEPAMRAVYDDPGYDGVVAINCGLDVAEFGAGVTAARAATGKPTVAYLLDVPTVEETVRRAGIPVFTSPERAVQGYALGAGR
jgi:acyl-CoA synthetase (NDP forming)